jgi:ATP-dependent Lon protease, bacterial type
LNSPGYILEEKSAIANQFLIQKQLQENGLEDEPIVFTPEALKAIVEGYTYEAGVRNLEREIGSVLRKIARLKSEGQLFRMKLQPIILLSSWGRRNLSSRGGAKRRNRPGNRDCLDGKRRRDYAH